MSDEITTPPGADQEANESQETKPKKKPAKKKPAKKKPAANPVDVLQQEFEELRTEASEKGLPAGRAKEKIAKRAAELGVPLSEVFDEEDDED